MLPHLRAPDVAVVFSRNFSRVLVNNLRNPATALHAPAKRCLVGVGGTAAGVGAGGSARTGRGSLARHRRLARAGGESRCGSSSERVTHVMFVNGSSVHCTASGVRTRKV